MPAAANTIPLHPPANASGGQPALEVVGMTKMQKFAALMIILGADTAASILKSFEPQELEALAAEISRMPVISQEMRNLVLSEMSELVMAASTTVRGGADFAQEVLERALGARKATDILNRVSLSTSSNAAQRIMAIEVRPLLNLIKHEHMQTIALVTSYLRPEKASELLGLLKPELRDQVIERLATLEATPVEVVEKIAEVLYRQLQGRTMRGLNQSGGVRSAASVLNAMNKSLTKTILTSLEERNAELGQAIRQKMFTFADLIRLDNAALQKVMREVDMRDLALALKKSDEALKSKLLGAISKRAAETVNEEIAFMAAAKLKDVEAAQARIIEIVRRLENEGEVDLEAPQEAA